MKIYISGAISGLPIEQAKKAFAEIEAAIVRSGHTAVNPMTLPHDHNKSYANYMREDIVALMGCNAVVVLPGWEQSEGANLEIQIALILNIKTYGLNYKKFSIETAIKYIERDFNLNN